MIYAVGIFISVGEWTPTEIKLCLKKNMHLLLIKLAAHTRDFSRELAAFLKL